MLFEASETTVIGGTASKCAFLTNEANRRRADGARPPRARLPGL